MLRSVQATRAAVAVALLVLAASPPAGATTLQRVGLERLVEDSSMVVVGEVVDAHSYWNDGATFILTDVVVAPSEYLKGGPAGGSAKGDLVVTLMGGTVGELTNLVIGGPELLPGRSYVLFVGDGDLPGAPGARGVRGMAQGAFDLVTGADGPRAVSQAVRQPLVADPAGVSEPPGGAGGLSLEALRGSVRELAGGPRPEVR